MSAEEFRAYWREHHAELVRSVAPVLGIRRYVQLDPEGGPAAEALARSRGEAATFDGIAELWFDDEEAILRSTDTERGRTAARALLEDEANFIDLPRSPIWLYREHSVLAETGGMHAQAQQPDQEGRYR